MGGGGKAAGKGYRPPPPPNVWNRPSCVSGGGGWLEKGRRSRAEALVTAAETAVPSQAEDPTSSQLEVDEYLDTSVSARFAWDDPKMLEHLDSEGYVVVKQVADKEELDRAEELLWHFMSDNAGWKRRDPTTWTDASLTKCSANGLANGIVNKCGAGQSDLSWLVRTNANVRRVFESVWKTSELLTSYDGFGLFRPWHHGFPKTLGGWFHVDQGRLKSGQQCVQGLMSLYDQDATTGGLIVIPGSHKHFDSIAADAEDDSDFIQLPRESPVWSMPHRLVTCCAGDFILWDSRCVHCNTPAVEQPTSPPGRLLRCVVYVCMTPKAWATEETLERRRKGYEMRMTTSHWPHTNVMGFGWAKAPPLDYLTAAPERRELIC